mmetsp:Transcript_7680/g.13931  ORF Transcript_7680/g.13931 Transcript_7680/m.13931 type:complete len:407 (-) Transcript_7680:697-1917(-)|eukprot:CAMPEP_0182442070 /NCGR_PEP_ID=MMETSP1172-20130603/1045_1 /TAXON_ID=708627 /ORGANISM="Timspurckia oligopyrenoides, Strain CCMP3278" /LENGTH=406 /DNA_ID=CAMNT_0024636763 /DNA_START=41 /DNA_END=1261 /DNA_ORIENTATION=+
MEEEKPKKSASTKVGGAYAKAKQRMLNKIGKRTTLTRNPRVDYISKKVDELRANKKKVSQYANSIRSHVAKAVEYSMKLNEFMLETWKEELGLRDWDETNKVYVRKLSAEEDRTVNYIAAAMTQFKESIGATCTAFETALQDVEDRPLTFCTQEEETRIATMKRTKEAYKLSRTEYSDAMINLEMEQASGVEPRQKTIMKVEEKQAQYDELSNKFAEDALKFETVFRDELSQRIASHFTSQLHFLKGMLSGYKQFYPYTKSLTLDLAALQRQIEHDKMQALDEDSDDDILSGSAAQSLPQPSSETAKKQSKKKKEKKSSKSARSPVGSISPSDRQESNRSAANPFAEEYSEETGSVADPFAAPHNDGGFMETDASMQSAQRSSEMNYNGTSMGYGGDDDLLGGFKY